MDFRPLFFVSLISINSIVFAADEYFYCGFSNLDGSGRDYARWGKGTDFKFNESQNRWEWISDYTFQYIYPDGRYEQITRGELFDSQHGSCNAEMEFIYKREMAALKAKHGK